MIFGIGHFLLVETWTNDRLPATRHKGTVLATLLGMVNELESVVNVTIRCPAVLNPATVDFMLQIPITDLVEDLKWKLYRLHPCRPDFDDQRLIFRGHILNDNLTIAEMCEKEKSGELVVHMVLKSARYQRPGEEIKPPAAETKMVEKETEVVPQITTTLPVQERPRIPDGFYGFLNDRGQVVYTDISNAVLFDGRQFYVMRGANFPTGHRLPFSMADASITVPRPNPPVEPARQPPHIWRRLNFDYIALLNFLIRMGLVVIIFSQGGDKWKIATTCAVFGMIFFLQAGVIPISLGRIVDRFWEVVMEPHRAQAGGNGEAGENREARENRGHAPNPNVARRVHNPIYKVLEFFTSFVLSLFPTAPPRAQEAAN